MRPNKEDCGLCKHFEPTLECKIGKEIDLTGWCASFSNRVIERILFGDGD